VVVSYWKELGTVKAFSTTSSFDPDSDEGPADLVKGGMERVIRAVEHRVGDIHKAKRSEIDSVLEINYRDSWPALEVSPSVFGRTLTSEFRPSDYQENQVLLTTAWHQDDPYNRDCPAGSSCLHCVVGCVATAGAQLMRYWHWPPYGVGSPYSDVYDWPNMPDTATAGSSPAEIAAVAELSHEIGVAVGMDYGCTLSESYTWDMEGVYEKQYRYSSACARHNRPDYTAADWFQTIKNQLNANRPTHYRVPGHSIVCDGWMEVGSPVQRYYHMNYGWQNTTFNTWYGLDGLHLGNPDEEYQLINIVPNTALGNSLSGNYIKEAFPYRYFDLDTTCWDSATFSSGQYLQSLAGITVNCVSVTGGSIRIYGATGNTTRMYNRGDPSDGIQVYDGCIKVMKYGGLVMH
jgi:hypothetical protein